jgi:hypothetical protein
MNSDLLMKYPEKLLLNPLDLRSSVVKNDFQNTFLNLCVLRALSGKNDHVYGRESFNIPGRRIEIDRFLCQ